MKLMKKIILLILTVILVALPILSCADNDDVSGPTPTGENDPTIGSETNGNIDENENEADAQETLGTDLPADLDFGGYDFRIFFRSGRDSNDHQVRGIMYTEEAVGEAMNDATIRRNTYLAERYNFNIVGIPSYTDGRGRAEAGTVNRSVMAGDDEFDAVMLRMSEAASLMTSGSIHDLADIPYFNFDRPWWNTSLIEQASVGSRKYMVTGDIIATGPNALRVFFFSKGLIADFELDCPYEMVRNGTWTLDNFYHMIQDVSADLDGDGIMGINDRFGFLVQGGASIAMFYSAGQHVITRDEDNLPMPLPPDTLTVNVLQRIFEILRSPDMVMFDQDFGGHVALMNTFADNRGLFFAEILHLAERMRAEEIYFGILPPPKADIHQEHHMVWADGWCLNMLVVPITNRDMTRTGQILELMAFESMTTTRPAFYDIALVSQFARDEESSEMLDIIIANQVISLCEGLGWGMHGAISGELSNRRGNFASAIEVFSRIQERNIDNFISALFD